MSKSRASSEISERFWVNARWSLGFKRKIFIVFLIGKDRRSTDLPTDNDRRINNSFAKVIIYSGIFVWFVISVAIVSFIVLYLLKSKLGIDLVSGSSPVPNFLKRIGLCRGICH